LDDIRPIHRTPEVFDDLQLKVARLQVRRRHRTHQDEPIAGTQHVGIVSLLAKPSGRDSMTASSQELWLKSLR
jgi:hypothetical protein